MRQPVGRSPALSKDALAAVNLRLHHREALCKRSFLRLAKSRRRGQLIEKFQIPLLYLLNIICSAELFLRRREHEPSVPCAKIIFALKVKAHGLYISFVILADNRVLVGENHRKQGVVYPCNYYVRGSYFIRQLAHIRQSEKQLAFAAVKQQPEPVCGICPADGPLHRTFTLIAGIRKQRPLPPDIRI